MNRITRSLKFLPGPLHKLIYTNVITVLNTSGFDDFKLVDLERMVDMTDKLIHCKATFQYGKKKTEKIVFTMKFKKGSMKSFQWSV